MRRWKLVLLVVGIAVAFAALDTAQTYLRRYVTWGRDPLWLMFLLMLQPWLTMAAVVPPVVWLARRFPIRRRRAIAAHLAGAALFPPTHLALLSLVAKLRHPEIHFLHEWAMMLTNYFVQDIFIYGVIAGITMIVHSARLEARLAEARLHALRGQLHPHFLFNVMNTVSMLIREQKPQVALDVLAELAVLLRAMLRDAGGHEVPLQAEVEFNRRYLELERARFGDRLTVTFECSDEVMDALVPQLVLQPLVENAVRHGIARVAGPGVIRVTAARHGDELALEVWNSGPSIVGESGGVGLRITRDRLAGLYGPRQAMALEPAPGGGVRARVTVPYHTEPLRAAS